MLKIYRVNDREYLEKNREALQSGDMRTYPVERMSELLEDIQTGERELNEFVLMGDKLYEYKSESKDIYSQFLETQITNYLNTSGLKEKDYDQTDVDYIVGKLNENDYLQDTIQTTVEEEVNTMMWREQKQQGKKSKIYHIFKKIDIE